MDEETLIPTENFVKEEIEVRTISEHNEGANNDSNDGSPQSEEDKADNDTYLWHKDATFILLEEYKKREELAVNGEIQWKQLWSEISDILDTNGYKVSWIKCSSRLYTLKRTFKNKLEKGQKSWPYFTIMQEILSDMPTTKMTNEDGSEDQSEEKELKRWRHDATMLLLEAYIQKVRDVNKGTITRRDMWTYIAKRIQREGGIHVTTAQCTSRFAGLKRTYMSMASSSKGKIGRKSWPYFDMVQEALKGSPKLPLRTASSSRSGRQLVRRNFNNVPNNRVKVDVSHASQPPPAKKLKIASSVSPDDPLECLRRDNEALIETLRISQRKTDEFREKLLECLRSALDVSRERLMK